MGLDASYDDRYGSLIDEQLRSVARLRLSKSSATRAVWWTGSNRRYAISGVSTAVRHNYYLFSLSFSLSLFQDF